MQQTTHAQITSILDRTPDLSLATIRPDGFPQATVVAFVHDDLVLYFATDPGAQKVRNIAACDKVSATITPADTSWDTIEGLSLAAHARRVTDAGETDLVRRLMADKFPEVAAAEAADVPEPLYVRLDPIVLSLLDYSRGFGHAETIDLQEVLPAA